MRWRANRLLLALTIFSVGGQLLPCDVLARAQETTPAPKTEATEKPDAPPAPTEPAPAEPSSGEPAKPQTQEPPPAASEPAPTRERPSRGPGRPTDAPRGRGSGARPTEGGTEQSSKEQAQPASRGTESPDSRLERIEKQLLEITKSLQGIQKEAPKSADVPKTDKPSDASASAAPEEKKSWDGVLSKEWLKGIRWRNVGPANMGGRIVDLAINENSPSTWWAATASGGLLKTTNNGISFEMQFDRESTVSIGAVAVSKSNPDILWVGTGENNPRNSVSYGDGVYKSTDGGKTWKNMGLKKTFQIGEIVIHPTDPNTVYVGALGRLYGTNEERGVYKTTDGGETWERCFYLDDRTGVIEMQMHPTDPNTLIVTAWERLRDGFDSWPGNEVPIPEGYDGYDPIRKWGPASGIYKTTDAGKNWKKLTKGLPTGQLGRIGIDWYRKDPNILFAIVDSENIGKGPQPLSVNWGAVGADVDGKIIVTQIYPKSPAEVGGLKVGDVVLSIGEQQLKSFDEILDDLRKKKGGDTLSLTIQRGDEKKTLEIKLTARSGRAGATSQQGVWFGGIGEDVDQGVKLTQVNPESPAGKASLQTDDILVEFDGQPAKAWADVVSTVTSKKAGDKVKVKLLRGDETKELEMTLENRPTPPGAQQPAAPARTYVGFQGSNAEKGGALLTEITADSPAEKAGLMKGDVVKSVNKKSVSSYRDLTAILATLNVGDKVIFEVSRATEVKEIEVIAAERPAPIRPYTASLGGQAANVQDQQGAKGYEYGGVYKSTDGGESWTRLNSVHSRPMYFSVIRVDPNDDQKIYLLGVGQFKSVDGGVTFDESLGRSVHADGHALWVDPKDGKHMIIGVDGGVYVTYDQGRAWDHLNTLPIGQFYHVAISPKYPYYLYGGLQDNGTWGGPAFSLSGQGPVNEDWLSVGGGDGFMCRVDPNDPDLVYWTSQNGAMGRRNMKTGERGSIRPRTVEGQPAYRFNWNTPFILSNANSRVFYAAGNYVFRSLDRGNNLEKISPEITLTKRGSATALSESPLDSNVLYVGTDDGALWVTKDGGKSWNEIGKGLNLPAPRWVATVEASRFAAGRVYISLDGHRSNDDEPYAFVSEDYGTTWKSIRSNLPWGSTRCLRESPFNENVLLVGTEFAVFASADRGATWNSLNTNLPTVPVFDFAFHPNNGEVVAATHGRSLWIADITPLHQFSAQQMEAAAHLYKPTTAIRWRREPSRGGTNRSYAGENPPSGAILYYSLSKKAKEAVVRIANAEGATIREIRGPIEPGLHRVAWDLISSPPQRGGRGEGAAGGRGEGTARRGAGGGGGFGGRATAAPSGTYKVTLSVDGKDLSQELRLVSDPNVTALGDLLGAEADYDVWFGDVEEEEEEEENEGVQSGLRERIRD